MFRVLFAPIIANLVTKPLCVMITLLQYRAGHGLDINTSNLNWYVQDILYDINTGGSDYAMFFIGLDHYYNLRDAMSIIFVLITYYLIIRAFLDSFGITPNYVHPDPVDCRLSSLREAIVVCLHELGVKTAWKALKDPLNTLQR